LALAAVRFVRFPRALPALGRFEFVLRSFARFCTFDSFLRLAMIAIAVVWLALSTTH